MKIRVVYWMGTLRCQAMARTYRGAMRIAARNQNAFPAKFYDEDGRKLYDCGFGLEYEEQQGDVIQLAV